jgi:hypothetical protein
MVSSGEVPKAQVNIPEWRFIALLFVALSSPPYHEACNNSTQSQDTQPIWDA